MSNELRPDEGELREPRIVQRLRRRRDAYRQRGRIYRALWVLAGFTVVIAGLAMTVLPGPAVVVIPLGLAMLSLEFAWAERLLEKSLAKSASVREKTKRANTRTKILVAIAAGGVVVGGGAAALLAL
jgi:tellurite resistance protein TerC